MDFRLMPKRTCTVPTAAQEDCFEQRYGRIHENLQEAAFALVAAAPQKTPIADAVAIGGGSD
jgi:hypothetical protein